MREVANDGTPRIYFIQAQRSTTESAANWLKIGYSKYPHHRAYALQTACPYPLELIGAIPGTIQQERRLHRYFSEHKVHGEWYVPAPEILRLMETGVLPFIEHDELDVEESDTGGERYLFTYGFDTTEEMQLLRSMLSNIDAREIRVDEWIEEAIREKLEREGILPDKKKK